MSTDPGPVLARGRASIIYDLRDGTVLRRYVGSNRSAEPEAEVIRLAAAAGVAVPVVHSATGPDILMDLVPGPTMLSDLADHPDRAPSHGRVLADLHASVDHVRPRDGSGLRLVHGDLHPGNLMLTERGGACSAASHQEVIDLVIGPNRELGGVKRVVSIHGPWFARAHYLTGADVGLTEAIERVQTGAEPQAR